MEQQKPDVDQVLREYADKFQVLADPLRLKILLLLRGEERCVCEIVDALGISQSLVSYHLKLMVEQGILLKRKKGTWNYYRLATDIGTWITKCCEWITFDDIACSCAHREQEITCARVEG